MDDGCPSKELLLQLLDDATGASVDRAIESHVAICQRCQQRLDVLTSYPALARLASHPGSDEDWNPSRSSVIVNNLAAALAQDAPNTSDGASNDTGDDRFPEIGGYDILDRIGAGGTADVYRAFHHQLRRIVALKLSRARAGAEDLDRFRRETEALARLRHRGIIQIYETGQSQGRFFMSLEYEPAGSLAKFLQGKPQPAREAARFLSLAAHAIHAAHLEKLVHRDLKPGNILLHASTDSSKKEGIAGFAPKVTDFGLVKFMAEDSALTSTRDVLGTPSYMAPEQVAGASKPIGPATDVYALGAMLYEMLTGRPPFRAATAIDTVVQVRFDEPVPPSRLAPSIPRDLETICLKCLEKEPSHRYPSAESLAEDLTRFVEGRPVLARPIRWPIRSWRWMRRNPRVAILSAILLSLLSALAIGGPIVAYRQSALRSEADLAKEKALAQRDRADKNMKAAGEAIWQSLLLKLADIDRSGGADANDIQRGLIDSAIPYLERAQSGDPDLPIYRQRWGIAMYLRGRAAARAGDTKKATEDLQFAASSLDRLAADLPEKMEVQIYASECRLELARLALAVADNRSEEQIREALRRFEKLIGIVPDAEASWDGLAQSATLLGDFLESQPNRRSEAVAPLARAIEARTKIALAANSRRGIAEQEVASRIRLAVLNRRLGLIPAAQDEARKALVAANRAPADGPPTTDLVLLRASTASLLAEILCDAAEWDEAARQAGQAVRIAEGLCQLFPGKRSFQANLTQCQLTLSRALKRQVKLP